MSEPTNTLAVRGMRLCLLTLPLILIGPVIAILFPDLQGEQLQWTIKLGSAMIWAGIGCGAVGLLMYMFNRTPLSPSERLQILIRLKPLLWLNLIALGGFLCLTLLRV